MFNFYRHLHSSCLDEYATLNIVVADNNTIVPVHIFFKNIIYVNEQPSHNSSRVLWVVIANFFGMLDPINIYG